ncbi:MAG: arylmalonate decarboxylase [Rhodospirillales bacterium]|jgi:maleate isomerase|nr:arylmalonate decarboxylase [Rhodospirillales bacterium]
MPQTPSKELPRYGWRARLGMLLPSGNVAAEAQFNAILPSGVSLHTTRLKLTGSTDKELLAMTEGLEEGASLLADACVDLILFHCTGVTTWDAEMDRTLPARITAATKLPATATSRALLAAFEALEAKRIVMVSPYIEAINAREAAFFESNRIRMLKTVGLGIPAAKDMISVEPGEWYRLVQANKLPDADAYFISCTAVRSLEVIEDLERDLGKPVVTSNQAAAWHSLRTLGIRDSIPGFGRLMTLQ